MGSSNYYKDFSSNTTASLQVLLLSTTLKITDSTVAGLAWVFTEGSTVATAANIPVLNVTDADDARAQLQRSMESSVDPDLTSATLNANDMCSNSSLNNCDLSGGTCTLNNAPPEYTCACNTGYNDTSVAGDGSRCSLDRCISGDLVCKNYGQCVSQLVLLPNQDIRSTCKCTKWYIGEKCGEPSGSLIGLIIGLILGLMLVIGLILMCCRYRNQSTFCNTFCCCFITKRKHHLQDFYEA